MGEPNGVTSARSEDSEIYEDAVQDEEEESDYNDEESAKDDNGKSPKLSQDAAPPRLPQHQSIAPTYPYYSYPPASAGYLPSYPQSLTSTSSSFPYPKPSRTSYVDNAHAADPKPDPRRNRGGVSKPFPEVLHEMLLDLEREGKGDVASFFSHGRAFAIHKPRVFITEVMPHYFRQTKLTSFQRQLNLYGFKRISSGIDNGGYWVSL